MGYDYYYDYSASPDSTGIMLGVLGGILAFSLIALVFSLLCYIFEAVGLYTIAKRRGIKSPWLAWIPIGSAWICGCIADQYQYIAKGQVKNRRMIILILSLASFVLTAMTTGRVMSTMTNLVMYSEYMSETEVNSLMMSMMAGGASGLFSNILSIALIVFQFITLYDLFCSCNPDNSTMFLVLSILFGILRPFFIFADRKKDLGMPARQPEPQPYTPQDPWENQ